MEIKYLIQVDNDAEYPYDFCYEMFNAKKYNDFIRNPICVARHSKNIKSVEDELIIPIGSVEFVHNQMKLDGLPIPKAINVPEDLFPYRNGFIENLVYGVDTYDFSNMFMKSFDLKGVTGMYEDVKDKLITGELYQVSRYEDIVSEYRCFVFKNELVGIKHYSGDFTAFPDIDTIKCMVDSWEDKPVACTIDIFMEKGTKEPYILECHNFYSVGLYGFNNYKLLPAMFGNWYFDYYKNNRSK